MPSLNNVGRLFNCFRTHNHHSSSNHNASSCRNIKPSQSAQSDVLEATLPIIYGDSASPYASIHSESCSICLVQFRNGETLRVLRRCGHVFHKECIDQWLPARSLNCPVCRDQTIDENKVKKPGCNDPARLLAPEASTLLAINFALNGSRCSFM